MNLYTIITYFLNGDTYTVVHAATDRGELEKVLQYLYETDAPLIVATKNI